ncbi:MAG: glycosyltransferase family 2 protein, partial [Bacteroidales bacterium]|nr:glycosyltransferase family 2 protein [Bacteroidales bacterium]
MKTEASPKVSVIVPFYQVERYIGQCARSLLGQTYPNIEFLFVDDGSTDRSREILSQAVAEFPGRSEMVRIIGDSHIGVPMIKIRGIEAATGDYLI